MDRYHEVKSILDRAIGKLENKSPIVKKPKFTMNLVSLALKASKWRREQEAKNSRNRYMPFTTKFTFEDLVMNSKIRDNRF
jgi:hypothetical protein